MPLDRVTCSWSAPGSRRRRRSAPCVTAGSTGGSSCSARRASPLRPAAPVQAPPRPAGSHLAHRRGRGWTARPGRRGAPEQPGPRALADRLTAGRSRAPRARSRPTRSSSPAAPTRSAHRVGGRTHAAHRRGRRPPAGRPTPGTRLVVIGAGWIGAEVATVAAAAGVDVVVVEATGAPLAAALGTVVGELTAPWYAAAGVRLLTGEHVVEVGANGVGLADGKLIAADLVLAAVGARPTTDWLAGALPREDDGALRVDEHHAVIGAPRAVRAVGDVALRRSRRHGWVPGGHWDGALRGPRDARRRPARHLPRGTARRRRALRLLHPAGARAGTVRAPAHRRPGGAPRQPDRRGRAGPPSGSGTGPTRSGRSSRSTAARRRRGPPAVRRRGAAPARPQRGARPGTAPARGLAHLALSGRSAASP